jgi:hypothetical protein
VRALEGSKEHFANGRGFLAFDVGHECGAALMLACTGLVRSAVWTHKASPSSV